MPTFAGTAGNDAGDAGTVTVKVYSGSSVSGSPLQTLTATRSGTTWSVPASAALALGTYTAQAEQSDSVGHTGRSAPSTFTIVAPPPSNNAPMCTDGTKTTPNATPASITLACTDADGDALTLSIVAAPGHGTLGSINAGSVTYTPTGTYAGSDAFTFKASDGKADSNVATISITVGPASPPPPSNHAPMCTDGTKTTPNATPASITLACTDADGDALTLSIVAAPGHGSLGSINAGSVTYTPTGTYAGSDSFTFKASDGKADSNVATISITVGPASPPTPTPTPKPKPKKCTVPQVVGKTLDVAKDAIKKAHCSTGKVNYARSRKVKKNVVLAQSHRPGQKLAVNTKINLVVSRGKK